MQGAFIEAADLLYRATGNKQYAYAAIRSAGHFLDNDPVVANIAGTATGAQLVQQPQNNTAAQQFILIHQ